jgi:FlaA1/EpsC-like NDP-sugar epimerase
MNLMSSIDITTNNNESQTYSVYKKNKPIDVTETDFLQKLLGRNMVPIYNLAARELIKDKVILVTGAGGSIGSEIVRQLVQLQPRKVYCIDTNELSLYNLSLELKGNALFDTDDLILADITDKVSMARIFFRTKPAIVFHAAAYKHLPLLERSVRRAIKNNVFGTDNIASLCVNYGVSQFVNISTDKAAKPTSVLGMTKRLAELCTAEYKNNGITKVASVRFGNVLGSQGSFLPTLIWQIENEITVSITHPEVSRYFMSIPEAAALVIEASVLATGGETFVLDMGKPVKILDLVKVYVNSTKSQLPNIVYTGLRPGEKLHEELYDSSEIRMPTTHQKISKVNVDLSGSIRYEDKIYLNSLVELNISSYDLKYALDKLIHDIENRLPSNECNLFINDSGRLGLEQSDINATG